jgi:Uma2 family endonuclease
MDMVATKQRAWTESEVRRIIDEAPEPAPRFELVGDQLLVTPSPNRPHQRIVLALAVQLDAFIRTNSLGEVVLSPSDIRLARGVVVQPDLFVVPAVNGKRQRASDPVTKLLLAIEVLSPASARFDRVEKRRVYQSAGVPEYWIFDPDSRLVERWRPADQRPEVLDTTLVWRPSAAGPALELNLVAIFAGAADAD